MINARYLAMPAIALTVIVALAQAHSRPQEATSTPAPTVFRAVNCAVAGTDASCAFAGNSGTTLVR